MPSRRKFDIEYGELMQSMKTLIEKVDEHREETRQMDNRLKRLEIDYTRYRSFFGGVIFVISAVWTFFVFTWDNFRETTTRLFGGH
jgi:uncharacterized membrane protein